jgi:L-fucose isomerase-like protein
MENDTSWHHKTPSAVIGSAGFSPDGAVASLADTKKYASLFRASGDEIDGIVVLLANFGDEIGVVETIRLAGLGVPVLIQASSEELFDLGVKGWRDS